MDLAEARLRRRECTLDRVGERPEQCRRSQHGRGDRDALCDRLGRVAYRVELGENGRALLVHVAGHLRDSLGVVADRAEGVHGDDDADCGQQPGAGEGDGEQRDLDRAVAHQVGAVDRGTDEQRRVDGRLEAHADAAQDVRGRARPGGLDYVLHRPAFGLGEVAREHLDRRREHDADEHRHQCDDLRVAVVGTEQVAGGAGQLAERRR